MDNQIALGLWTTNQLAPPLLYNIAITAQTQQQSSLRVRRVLVVPVLLI